MGFKGIKGHQMYLVKNNCTYVTCKTMGFESRWPTWLGSCLSYLGTAPYAKWLKNSRNVT